MSLESWTAHQTALGLHRYGVALEDAGLTLEQLLQHAAQEGVDLGRYLRAALRLAPAGNDLLAMRLQALVYAASSVGESVAELAGPAPEFVAPPMCPSSAADLERWGFLWYVGGEVVRVAVVGVERWFLYIGDARDRDVDPSLPWLGPVPKPRRSVLPVAP